MPTLALSRLPDEDGRHMSLRLNITVSPGKVWSRKAAGACESVVWTEHFFLSLLTRPSVISTRDDENKGRSRQAQRLLLSRVALNLRVSARESFQCLLVAAYISAQYEHLDGHGVLST